MLDSCQKAMFSRCMSHLQTKLLYIRLTVHKYIARFFGFSILVTQLVHWTIYSATSFLEKCRKVVREIWFKKSGSRKVVDQKKRWFYTINPHFFWFKKSGWPEKKIRVWRTTFLEPLFYIFQEERLQNKWSSGFPKVFQVFSRGFSKMALMCIFLFIIFNKSHFFIT